MGIPKSVPAKKEEELGHQGFAFALENEEEVPGHQESMSAVEEEESGHQRSRYAIKEGDSGNESSTSMTIDQVEAASVDQGRISIDDYEIWEGTIETNGKLLCRLIQSRSAPVHFNENILFYFYFS